MKFENIKAGDTVLVQRSISTGFHRSESFWLPCEVEKVTPKQFVAGGKRFRKADGSEITSDYGRKYAAYEGDKFSSYDGGTATDQTDQAKVLKGKLAMVRAIRDKSSSAMLSRIDYDNKNLGKIYHLIEETYKLAEDGA